MAIFLPLVASATCTSLGGIAQCVPESNSVDSMSLPSGSFSPTLIAIAGLLWIVSGGKPDDTGTFRAGDGPSRAMAHGPVTWQVRERLARLAWLLDSSIPI